MPIAFASVWCIICFMACQKDGDYNAPPGMLYMQQEDEENKRMKDMQANMSTICSTQGTDNND